jgi:predicted acylesterase/phospholipase RssA
MSMSVPLLWQEVEWEPEWGPYYTWNPVDGRLEPRDMTGHTIVDGGLLSNFPIALFLADRDDITAIVGPPQAKNVLGLLIDEAIGVPGRPADPEMGGGFSLTGIPAVGRLRRLINTATSANDNMAVAAFAPHVVRLPAGGYGTTQFDMTDAQREALVNAGRTAMRAFLGQQVVLEGVGSALEFAVGDREMMLANQAALEWLNR